MLLLLLLPINNHIFKVINCFSNSYIIVCKSNYQVFSQHNNCLMRM